MLKVKLGFRTRPTSHSSNALRAEGRLRALRAGDWRPDRRRGLSPAESGLALTAAALTWSAGSWLRGRREDRWDDRTVLRVDAASLAVGIGLAAGAVWPSFPVAASLLGWGVAGFGMGLVHPTLSLLTLRLSAPEEQGRNSSALQMNESFAGATVLAVCGPVFAALVTGSTAAAYLTCFATSGILALAAIFVAGRVRAAAA